MTVLPLIFDTIPGLGATKLRDTFPYPFLNLTGHFETLAAVVTFSRFWAGKFHRHATNKYIVIVHHCHGVSRQNKTKNGKVRGPNMKNGCEMIFHAGDETLGVKRCFTP
jgi:hypothetical protein